jgi:hypothetical protein
MRSFFKRKRRDGNIVQLPHPTTTGGSFLSKWKSKLKLTLGRAAQRIGLPGCVARKVLDDPVTGQHMEIRVDLLFTVISVDGRDYYFRRWSGQYDGAGMGCSIRSSCCISDQVPKSEPSPSYPYHL